MMLILKVFFWCSLCVKETKAKEAAMASLCFWRQVELLFGSVLASKNKKREREDVRA